MNEPSVRSIEASTHGRFLVHLPPTRPPYPLLVGFHGYGENAERHLAQLRQIAGIDAWMLVSVQGLHRFYAGKFEEVVASWMTRQDREQMIADNLRYVDRVVETVRSEHATNRLVFAGFSQGVAMAFRAAVLGAVRADGIVALGGDVPPDVRDEAGDRFPPVLLGAGSRDPWYTEDKLSADAAFLESKGVSTEVARFDGGHEWTAAFRDCASQFLRSLRV